MAAKIMEHFLFICLCLAMSLGLNLSIYNSKLNQYLSDNFPIYYWCLLSCQYKKPNLTNRNGRQSNTYFSNTMVALLFINYRHCKLRIAKSWYKMAEQNLFPKTSYPTWVLWRWQFDNTKQAIDVLTTIIEI